MTTRAHRVLVCGGRRSGVTRDDVFRALSKLDPRPDLLIEGGAMGVDAWARAWGEKHCVHVATVYPIWSHGGRSAGPRRNAAMLLLEPTLVVAFPGGNGTADMIQRARRAGVPVLDLGSKGEQEP